MRYDAPTDTYVLETATGDKLTVAGSVPPKVRRELVHRFWLNWLRVYCGWRAAQREEG